MTSLQIATAWFLVMAAVFLFQIGREWIKSLSRRESRGFAFARAENVYPKFKL